MTCRHPEIARINYLLVSGGASLRPLAAKFNLSVNSLHYEPRHTRLFGRRADLLSQAIASNDGSVRERRELPPRGSNDCPPDPAAQQRCESVGLESVAGKPASHCVEEIGEFADAQSVDIDAARTAVGGKPNSRSNAR